MINFDKEDCLKHFRETCVNVTNLDVVKNLVIKGECPFLDMGFERDVSFRAARRYYRGHIELKDDFLRIIEEMKNVKYVGN